MKGRKGGKRISVRRKMLMNEQQETFNQQQEYYREFFYKSKANNFQIKKKEIPKDLLML